MEQYNKGEWVKHKDYEYLYKLYYFQLKDKVHYKNKYEMQTYFTARNKHTVNARFKNIIFLLLTNTISLVALIYVVFKYTT